MHRPQEEGRLADPVSQGRAVQVHTLPAIDLSLPVKRQVVGVFGDEDMGDGCLGGDAALDEPGGHWGLHHDLLAGPAGVFWPTGHDHAELGGDDVETLGDVLAHRMQLAPAARAGLVMDVDDLLDARQVRGQRSAIGAPLPDPVGVLDWISRLLAGEALGLDLLGLLEPQQQLIDWQALGPAAEAMTLELLDDLAQPLVLGALLREHRPKRDRIADQWVGCVVHEADSIMDYSGLPVCNDQLAAMGTRVSRRSCTRRQSRPSSNACNCAAVSRTTPSAMAGHWNLPSSSLFENRQTPVPSK